MNQASQKLGTKPTQYTRKKIQNYSYGLNDVIGKGYSSQVYKGRNDNNDIHVAVKVIDLKMLKNQINRILLESQIEILKQLKNKPNILTLHDVYTTKNNTYIITQLCSSDMNKIIKSQLTETEAYFYMTQLLDGYKEIYRHEIVHRDLKPANLLVTDQKILKVADFGFGIKSKQLAKPSKYNVGSPLYMAPESLKKNQYSFKTDLWSIGVIFFEMLTGDTPWRAKTQKQLIKKIESESIRRILQKKAFSKMTIQFLEKILCLDKNYRMSPEQLDRFNFRSQVQGSILCQKKMNGIVQRKTRFQSLNSVNTSNFVSPKHMFNQSIQKNFFQRQKSQTNMLFHKNSNKDLTLKIKKQHQTMKEINQNINPMPSLEEKSKPINPQILKSEDKKSISKVLISIVHFCRFLYKLLNRIKESESHGILKEIGYFEVQGVNYAYTITIKYLINLLVNLPKRNFLKLPHYQQYKETSDYTKLMKISKEYYERYSTELKAYWNNEEVNNEFQNKFSSIETTKLIKTMTNYTQDIINGMQDPKNQVTKLSKDIIIIDYLMTSKQLLEMFEDGMEDYFMFSKKSRIEDIVEGNTSEISYVLYKKIMQKANSVIFINSSNLKNKDHKRHATILNECGNSLSNTTNSLGSFKFNNPLVYNR